MTSLSLRFRTHIKESVSCSVWALYDLLIVVLPLITVTDISHARTFHTLLLALKICLNVFVVSRVVSGVAQPARALIDSSVNFLQPKIRNVSSSVSVATALMASSVSFSQFRKLSEVREVQPAARA